MLRPRTFAIALFVLAAACGKDKADDGEAKAGGGGGKGGAACPPLKVTIGGQEVTGLGHGLAITQKMGSDVSEQVQLFNHDQATCEQVLSKSGRQVPAGEISIRANAGRSAMSTGVGIGSHAQLGVKVDLVGPAPTKPGDKVTLCARNVTFKPTMGEHADQEVTIDGTLEGTFCGVMEF